MTDADLPIDPAIDVVTSDPDPVVQQALHIAHLASLTTQVAELKAQQEALVTTLEHVIEGHNTIGQMMQEAYNVISQIGSAFSKGGIGGLMSVMKGQNNGNG